MLQIQYLQQPESLQFNIRSFDKFQNLGQTSSWFGLARNPCNKLDSCMYQLLQILETTLTDRAQTLSFFGLAALTKVGKGNDIY